MKVEILRKFLAIVAALTLVSTLSACASSEQAAACPAFNDGTEAQKISASGSSSAKPTVTFKAPLATKKIETHVITEGKGPVVVGDQMVKFDYVILNGTTGKEIQASSYDSAVKGEQAYLKAGDTIDLCHALSGVHEGSRVSVLVPAGATSNDSIAATDSIAILIDLRKVYLQKVVGTQKASDSGMPTVVAAPSGQPGVAIPKSAAPTVFKSNTLIDGSGDAIAMGDSVTVQYSGFLWATGAQFDSSWTNGQPAQFQIADGALIPGFIKALVGAKVGSRILAVIPPSEGYGAEGNSTIPGDSTLVFVVDVLGVDKSVK